jgi:hypothetical protein
MSKAKLAGENRIGKQYEQENNNIRKMFHSSELISEYIRFPDGRP